MPALRGRLLDGCHVVPGSFNERGGTPWPLPPVSTFGLPCCAHRTRKVALRVTGSNSTQASSNAFGHLQQETRGAEARYGVGLQLQCSTTSVHSSCEHKANVSFSSTRFCQSLLMAPGTALGSYPESLELSVVRSGHCKPQQGSAPPPPPPPPPLHPPRHFPGAESQ